MANFTGQLRPSDVFTGLYNMILGQVVFADNFQKHQTLVEKAKEEAGLYGDQKLFYSCQVLESEDWTGHVSEAANLLATKRPAAPKCQALVIDNFKMVWVSTDEYLSKRAWSTESAFADFTSVIIDMISQAKKIHEGTLYNTFIGTDETSTGKQSQEVDLRSASAGQPLYGYTGLDKDRKEAMLIAEHIANLLVDMSDYSKDFNDYQFLRSYSEENVKVIWNSDYINKIRKVELPSIYHSEGLVDKFGGDRLPARYFGITLTSSNIGNYSAATPTKNKPIDSDDGAYTPGVGNANGKVCSRVERTVTVGETDYHVLPGDELPAGATVGSGKQFDLGEAFIPDETIIAKIVVKLPPVLTAFETSTSFYNPRGLMTNRYLIWGYSTLEHLKNYPMITIRAKKA